MANRKNKVPDEIEITWAKRLQAWLVGLGLFLGIGGIAAGAGGLFVLAVPPILFGLAIKTTKKLTAAVAEYE